MKEAEDRSQKRHWRSPDVVVCGKDQGMPDNHLLRLTRQMVEEVIELLFPPSGGFYSKARRPSIPHGQLSRSLLPHMRDTIRSEHMCVDQMGYKTLFRWIVARSIDDPFWDPPVITTSRSP
jgi:transposase